MNISKRTILIITGCVVVLIAIAVYYFSYLGSKDKEAKIIPFNVSPFEGKIVRNKGNVYEVVNGKAVSLVTPENVNRVMMERYGKADWILQEITDEELKTLS